MNRLSNIPCAGRFVKLKVHRRVYSYSIPALRIPCLISHADDRQIYRSTIPTSLRRRTLFSTNAAVQQPQRESENSDGSQPAKRKKTRSPAAKNSLRRVAVEAQRSRDGILIGETSGLEDRSNTKVALRLSMIKGNWADQVLELLDRYSLLCRRGI